MANYNKVILIGNLTRDPQMSYLPSQTPVTEIGLAVNRRWRGQDGQQREETCFVDCRAYGRQAELLNQYMRKGRPLLVEGRLQLDRWEDRDGQKRSKHRVFIERFQFLGDGGRAAGGDDEAPQAGRAPATRAPATRTPGAPTGPAQGDFQPPDDQSPDDIPF
jgi:single-strand DNA-binding protein